jgi:peptidyl-prolyl cis-trans isomerase D
MLLKIRELASGWLATIIFVLLIIPFAFWGINFYFGSGGNTLAVEVNGEGIRLQDFQLTYQNIRQRWQSMTGDTVTDEMEPVLKQDTVDNLVNRELIRQTNEKLGMAIGDKQLTDTIKKIPEFQGVDGFDTVIYEQSISRLGYNSAGFEAQMRADLAVAQLRDAVTVGSFVTGADFNRMVSLIAQERDIRYAILSSDQLKERMEISDADIETDYARQAQEYMNPEQVRIAYIDLSLMRMADAVQVDEAGLKGYYETNKALYEVEDQRTFKQLFIATGPDTPTERVEAVRAEVNAMRELIAAGSSFEEAKASRSNEISAGAEIIGQDFMTKGILEPEIDAVLFALKVGEISEPIVTRDGVHLIMLEGIKGGITSTFEQVRDQVERDYRLSLVESDFADAVDQATNLAFEHPDTLQPIADNLNLTVQVSPFFDRQWQPEELLRNPKIVNASFSEEVLIKGNNSDPIEVEENRLIVLRVLEHKPAAKKPLAEVRDRVITRLKFERARDETRKRGAAIVEELRKTGNPDELAGKHGYEWRRTTGVRRDNAELDGAVLRAAFNLGRPQTGQPVYGGATLASGDYAIISIEAVWDAPADAMTKDELTALQGQLENAYANDVWAFLVEDLRANSEIQVFTENL